MGTLVKIIVIVGILAGATWLTAQMAVWGLSLYHVDSGMWGPLMLIGVFESAVGVGVRIGWKS